MLHLSSNDLIWQYSDTAWKKNKSEEEVVVILTSITSKIKDIVELLFSFLEYFKVQNTHVLLQSYLQRFNELAVDLEATVKYLSKINTNTVYVIEYVMYNNGFLHTEIFEEKVSFSSLCGKF